jgi:Ca2+-binding RTX toxin-like protein
MAYRNFAGTLLPDTNQAGVRYVNGSWAGETLNGSPGADQFEGGGGRDTFVGQGGDDFYWVRDTLDTVVEWAGGGVDTIKIWSSYTLPANVENLIVFGGGSYAAGNDGDNIIEGVDGDQFIYGAKGADVLVGGGGADTFLVRQGEGNKVIQDFQPWSDKIRLIGGQLNTFDEVKAAMTQQGSDVLLNDGGTQILFRNISVGQFVARDFQLPLDMRSLGATTFSDDFNSLQLGSVWKTNFGYAGDGLNSFTLPRNSELQIYTSPDFKGTTGAPLGLNPYSINNGILTIKAQPVSADTSSKMWGYQYSSGMLDSHYQQTYGYFEIRAELPHGKGLWPAFWLLGEQNSEIDILEGLGSDTKVPHNAIHSNSVPAAGLQNFVPDDSGFHTYGALWSPSDIIFYVDGTEVWRTPTPYDINKPMHMIVNLAVGGPWAGAPDGSTPWPGEMKVDYVKAWNLPDPNWREPTGPTPPPPVVTPPPVSPPPPTSDTGQVLTSSFPGATLRGGAGADTLNASQGADTLTGGGGADVFAIKAMPWNAGKITDFTVGSDKLNVSALYTNGYGGADPVADRYVTFLSDGAGGTKVMMDVDGPAGPNSLQFHVVTLQGVGPSGLTAANVFGGTGGTTTPPPVNPPPSSTGQVLTSGFPGATLNGGAGADTLNASQGADMLTGGGGADVFAIKAMPWSAGKITDFTVGTDKLDVSALYTNGYRGADPVADRYVTFQSDGAGGTRVMMDVDGPSGPSSLQFHVVTLQGVGPSGLTAANVFGAAGGTTTPPPVTPPPATPGQVLKAAYPGATVVGGSGADTLMASQGPDKLTGGAGADYFDFDALPWNAGRVTDFQTGVDKLDLRGLASAYTGGSITRDLSFLSDGAGGTKVMLDVDGPSGGQWPFHITTLDSVAPSSLTRADWLF